MRRSTWFAIPLCCLAWAAVAAGEEPAQDRDPICGAWTVITPYGGVDLESHLAIARSAEGVLSATYVDSNGGRSTLEDVSFKEGVLKFVRASRGRRLAFEGRVKGDRLEGAHQVGPRKIAAFGARGDVALAALREERREANKREDDLEADYEKHSRRAAPRDAFPVLFDPRMTPAALAGQIRDDEPVIGVALGGEAKAYPVSIMGRHELANDTLGGRPITASW